MRSHSSLLQVVCVILSTVFLSMSNEISEVNLEKIKFDMSGINEEGLTGPPGGLRSVRYEFCIPLSDNSLEHVMKIDPTIQCYKRSRGRVQCGENQQLCIAETYNESRDVMVDGVPSWKNILFQLTNLDIIDSIELSFGE